MNTTVKTLAAAALAMAVALPVSAQNPGETMLLSAVRNEVVGMGITEDQLDNLSLNQLVEIATIVRDPEETDNTKRTKIQQIVDSAN